MKNKVPKLRFPEFSGEWKEKRLKNGYELISGQHLNPNEYSIVKNNKPYFTGPSDFTDSIENITKWSLIEGKKAKKGDILFTVKGSGVGTLTVLKLSEVVMGRQLMAITSKDSSTLFLSQYLKTKKEYFESLARGNMIPGLSRNDILDLKYSSPLLPEQEKIANFLSSVDIKIEKLEKKKELLEKYKKGMMQKLFSQKLRFKDDNGNDYPEWEEKRLGEVCSLKNGLSFDQNLEKKGFPVTRIETISNRNININKIGYVETEKNIEDYKLQIGDILFSNINSVAHIGKIAYVDKEYNLYHGMNLLNIRFYKEYNSKFLYFMIGNKKYKNYFEKMCNQAVNQASINQTDLKKVKLIIPSFTEQEKIANFLSSIDRKIELIEQELEKNKEFKKGLLQQMFV